MSDIEETVLRKIAWRFLPLLVVAYIVNYLDRTSISVAALTMNHDLGFTGTQFGFAAGVFFVGYCLFGVPSNLALYKYGSRIWLTCIMVTWGLASAATAFVAGPKSFYAVRFFLGVAEAGFFPGVIYFLSCWFPNAQRARILAWFMLGIPVSSLIGSPIAGLLLGMNGIAGLAGWKWMFILVSVPAVLVGCILAIVIVDTPEKAQWLSGEERSVLGGMLKNEESEKRKTSFKATLLDPRVFILSAIQFGFLTGSYGIGLWLPQIFKRQTLSNFHVSIISAVPYLFAMLGQIIWAAYSDKKDNKVGNVVISSLLGAFGLILSVQGHSLGIEVLGITLALIGINAARAIFWAIPPRFLRGAAAAGGFALINTMGTIGGFVGPYMVGFLKDTYGSFSAGLWGMAVILILAAVMAASLKLVRAN